MALDTGLIDWVAEAMAPIGTVTMRRMMGGATLYLDGTIFAISSRDALWFKADGESDAAWDAAGCPRFAMERRDGSIASMNYRRAPDDVYDDADALREWAGLALAAGMRAPSKKAKSRKGEVKKTGARTTR
ncbi:TfoX/Sxy family protein [Sphingomonas sp. So64.6b]|uniref:TfoX/Sxy family protein n=1 Tax=Sphingomonas sp. So64.6b TaxID=2997354 RepID=UPI0015FF63C1|nr:TfoX/Sxy family protein [Sphingomonas sp. So64.6b]QNA86212.1 TfoX/Sxy family protein [Sphingomonas sp. So64.6b]